MKTSFAGKNPFKEKKAVSFVDINSLVIGNDPHQPVRARTEKKYEPLFEKMKPGQCIVCKPEDAGKIAHAMTQWIKATKFNGVARSTSKYETDGKGRVWLIAFPTKLKAAA